MIWFVIYVNDVEYAAKASLFEFLQTETNSLNFENILVWAKDIALGEQYSA